MLLLPGGLEIPKPAPVRRVEMKCFLRSFVAGKVLDRRNPKEPWTTSFVYQARVAAIGQHAHLGTVGELYLRVDAPSVHFRPIDESGRRFNLSAAQFKQSHADPLRCKTARGCRI